MLTVITATMYRRFRLRVVRNPDDAWRRVVLLRPEDEQPAEETPLENEERGPEEAGRRGETPAPDVAMQPLADGHEPTPERIEHMSRASRPPIEPAVATAPSPRFDVAVHAALALGYTGLDIAGYGPQHGFQFHQALSLRFTGTRPGARWALEGGVSAERMAGSVTHTNASNSLLEIRGPWLRAEVGVRGWLESRWSPTAYLGGGAQVQLRQLERTNLLTEQKQVASMMMPGPVLVLGMGLQYRTRKVWLGLDFQARGGGPDGYFAVSMLWTAGYFLNRGE